MTAPLKSVSQRREVHGDSPRWTRYCVSFTTLLVFKSLHKPLTYLGVERTLFYFVCVGAVGPSISSIPSSRVSPSSLAVLPSAIG
jgi:hypothetical protein